MSEREPLTGDAAREALTQVLHGVTTNHPCTSEDVAVRLLATGRVVVLPEADVPCVDGIGAEIYGVLPSLARESARRIHAAGLCACRAEALLRRWREWEGSSPVIEHVSRIAVDTRAYLEDR